MTKKVLISTGGSGGHVIPAITIYNHLKNTHEALISTDKRGLKYLEKNFNFHWWIRRPCNSSNNFI